MSENHSNPTSTHEHRHHSRAYYKYRVRKHKVKKLFRKHKALGVVIIVLIVAVSAAVAAIAIHNNNAALKKDNAASTTSNTAYVNNHFLGIQLPYFDEPQVLVDPVVLSYVNDETMTPLMKRINPNSDAKLDVAKNVGISYQLTNLPQKAEIKGVEVKVSDNASFQHSLSYENIKAGDSCELKFLETGKKYYYRVTVNFKNGMKVSSDGSFTTAQSPRILAIDGVHNVRDIGGWSLGGEKRVKQGMLYRGPELDGLVDPTSVITDRGISDVFKYLGVNSDFDLRGRTDKIPKTSALGARVNHRIYDCYEYSDCLKTDSHRVIGEIFSDLADKKNYPVYLHCTFGKDRTGTICFLLEALLGMSDQDLIREYELSGLAYKDTDLRAEDSKFQQFLTDFYNMKGKDAKEKAENYLLECGVTKDEIENIRAILTE